MDQVYAFLLAEILNFQGSTHRIGVGSLFIKLFFFEVLFLNKRKNSYFFVFFLINIFFFKKNEINRGVWGKNRDTKT